MPVQTHRRPDLKAPISKLLEKLAPAVGGGGDVPLTALVEAVAGSALEAGVRKQLDARKSVVFKIEDGQAAFINEGPDLKIELKNFDIKIPKRLAGYARTSGDGAILKFEGRETLSATKFFFSVKLERIEVTSTRVFIDMEGDNFDQVFELG